MAPAVVARLAAPASVTLWEVAGLAQRDEALATRHLELLRGLLVLVIGVALNLVRTHGAVSLLPDQFHGMTEWEFLQQDKFAGLGCSRALHGRYGKSIIPSSNGAGEGGSFLGQGPNINNHLLVLEWRGGLVVGGPFLAFFLACFLAFSVAFFALSAFLALFSASQRPCDQWPATSSVAAQNPSLSPNFPGVASPASGEPDVVFAGFGFGFFKGDLPESEAISLVISGQFLLRLS